MATTDVGDLRDIRFDRIDQEYLSLRGTQDRLMISLDRVLSTMVKSIQENRELILENRVMIQENRVMIQENRELIRENRELTQENRSMLLAIIKHLEVPYQPKPPMGFNIDPPD